VERSPPQPKITTIIGPPDEPIRIVPKE
jgi:hypothetical protein